MDMSKEALGFKLEYKKQVVSDLLGKLKDTGLDVGLIESAIENDNYGGWDVVYGKERGAAGLLSDLDMLLRAEARQKEELINELTLRTIEVTKIKEQIKGVDNPF